MSVPDEYVLSAEDIGLDEVEPGIVEDTFENRKVLRFHKIPFHLIYDGAEPTGLIKLIPSSEASPLRRSVWDRRKPVMVDPTDRWSEYLSPLDFPLDVDAPYWVRNRVRRYELAVSEGRDPEAEKALLPVRCGVIRHDGTRCWNWASRDDKATAGNTLCQSHLGWTTNRERAALSAARARIIQAAPAAAEGLEQLALKAEAEPVRLRAQTEILDRAGIRGGVELDMNVTQETSEKSAAEIVRERLAEIKERAEASRLRALEEREASAADAAEDIVDAVVVSDSAEETR